MSDYPRMLYHEDGRSAVVEDHDEEKAMGKGWGRKSYASHQDETAVAGSVPSSGPPSAHDIRLIVREELAAMFGERDASADEDAPEPVFDTAAEPVTEAPKRRGRPPANREQES